VLTGQFSLEPQLDLNEIFRKLLVCFWIDPLLEYGPVLRQGYVLKDAGESKGMLYEEKVTKSDEDSHMMKSHSKQNIS
jgi:hypothetical protein